MGYRLISMKTAGVIALLLSVSACTRSAEESSFEVSSDLLLAASELGTSWSRQLGEEFTSRGTVPVIDEKSWCDDATASTEQLKGLAGISGAVTSLKNAVERGSSHTITEQVWQASGASEFVAVFDDAVSMCDGKSWTTSQNEKFSFASLDVPAIGEAAAAGSSTILISENGSTSEWVARMTVVRIGDVVIQVRELDVRPLGAKPKLTFAEWNDTVRLAVQKVEKAIGE